MPNRFISGHSRTPSAGGGGGGALLFVAHYENGAATTTYSSWNGLATVSTGTAAADRLIVAIVCGQRTQSVARTLSSITLDGTPMTIHRQSSAGDASPSANPSLCMGIASLLVPTGTTAAVTATFNSNCAGAHLTIYRLTGLVSNTPYATSASSSNGSNPATTLDIPGNGLLLAGYSGSAPGSGGSAPAAGTWSGVSTEDWDEGTEGSSTTFWGSSASQTGMSAEVARAISVTNAATGHEIVIAGSWR